MFRFSLKSLLKKGLFAFFNLTKTVVFSKFVSMKNKIKTLFIALSPHIAAFQHPLFLKFANKLFWGVKLWLITLVVPCAITVMYIFYKLIGMLSDVPVTKLIQFWKDYYLTGSLWGLDAWRVHLGILLLTTLYSFFHVDE